MEGEKPKREEFSDVEELRMVLKAFSEFVREIQEPLKELIKTMIEPVKGDVLGGELAKFYKSLKEAGVPEDMAQKLTIEYFEKRTKILESMGDLGELLSKLSIKEREMREGEKEGEG